MQNDPLKMLYYISQGYALTCEHHFNVEAGKDGANFIINLL